MKSALSGDFSQTIIFLGHLSITHSKVHIPVGPAPITRTVSSCEISDIRAAQKPVASTSPTKRACSSLTPSGIRLSPLSANGTRTYSACPPSIRHPNAHPPSGSVQLFTYPFLQKKHLPQKVSTFTATRSPGLTPTTSLPTSSTTPTISCPTVIPGTARGTLPCFICRSLVHMLPRVTLTTASCGLCKHGLGFSFISNLPPSTYVYASIFPSIPDILNCQGTAYAQAPASKTAQKYKKLCPHAQFHFMTFLRSYTTSTTPL